LQEFRHALECRSITPPQSLGGQGIHCNTK
jgi:hypothetical protein